MTRQQAINAFCKQCIHDPTNGGTWTEQVGLCTSFSCPLWPYRALPRYARREEWRNPVHMGQFKAMLPGAALQALKEASRI